MAMTTILLPSRLRPARPRFSYAVAVAGRRALSSLDDHSVTIGDVRIDHPPRGNSPHLIPALPSRFRGFHEINDGSLPACHLSHLRWMLQKDLALKQDFLLLGVPGLARERYGTSFD